GHPGSHRTSLLDSHNGLRSFRKNAVQQSPENVASCLRSGWAAIAKRSEGRARSGRGAGIVALLNRLSQRFLEIGRRPRPAGTASAVVALPGLTKTGLRQNHRDQFVDESFRLVRKKARAREFPTVKPNSHSGLRHLT